MESKIQTFVHSLSTLPFKINCYNMSGNNRLIGNIWFYSLSVAYIKRLGLKINLHTDKIGKLALSHLPYDNIYLDCEGIENEVHPRLWASAKFFAMKNEDLNSLHIDGDVFIKNENIIKEIENSKWGCLVQSYEKGLTKWYTSLDEHFVKYNDLFKEKYNFDCLIKGAYNTGIVGFRNKELNDQFINDYIDLAKFFSKECKNLFNESYTITPDLLIEQQRLYQISQNNYVKTLLKGNSLDELQSYATKIGYQHVCSPTKFNFMNELQLTLKNVDIDIYNKTLEQVNQISKLIV